MQVHNRYEYPAGEAPPSWKCDLCHFGPWHLETPMFRETMKMDDGTMFDRTAHWGCWWDAIGKPAVQEQEIERWRQQEP